MIDWKVHCEQICIKQLEYTDTREYELNWTLFGVNKYHIIKSFEYDETLNVAIF